MKGSAPTPATRSEHDRLFDLFKRSDEDSLRRNPLSALLRGDMRFSRKEGIVLAIALLAWIVFEILLLRG